uniref:Uncharacterized protein n=1 Tax=Oryza brachyantha TaxID=4533 RepID=J3LIV8_ORYBR
MDGRSPGSSSRPWGTRGSTAAVGLDKNGGGGGGDLMLAFKDFMRIVERKGGNEEEREELQRAFGASRR